MLVRTAESYVQKKSLGSSPEDSRVRARREHRLCCCCLQAKNGGGGGGGGGGGAGRGGGGGVGGRSQGCRTYEAAGTMVSAHVGSEKIVTARLTWVWMKLWLQELLRSRLREKGQRRDRKGIK